jgi:thioredoxin reductase
MAYSSLMTPARNTIAIVGAGPIGLEALSAALDHGFDVHLFEQGEAGAHPIAWGHVRMFTPWRMNAGPASARRLARAGWKAPDPEAFPTGLELAERLLQPLAALPELKPRVHTHAQVVHASRSGALQGDLIGDPRRREHPFRLLVRDPGGRESFLHAHSLIDASGVYAKPNWAGDGGIPARGELYLAPQMSYHVDDVLGARRERYAGRRTLVIGGGASGATSIVALAELAQQAPGTAAVWATRERAGELLPEVADDPLPERRALHRRAREIARGGDPAIVHAGGAVVDGFEFNSATHRYRATLMIGGQPRVEEVDEVLVNTGFGPDHSFTRELQVHECYATRGIMKLSAALLGAQAKDCLDTPAFGIEALRNPEPGLFVLGHKSYGRNPNFLLENGYRQVAEVVAALAQEIEVAAKV